MTEDVDNDDHLSMIAKANGKGAADSHAGDSGLHATANAPQLIQVNVDKSIGKQIILVLWLSAFMSALAALGLAVAWIGYRHNVSYVNVLQYDLMDLRAKTGHAHENTPEN